MDVDQYLRKMGYEGKGRPGVDLATLENLQQLHQANIPYENLDAVLGKNKIVLKL